MGDMVRQQAHLVALGAVVVCLLGGIVRAEDGPAVDYLRDVKPILKARCFACHGALKQQAGLRLDSVSAMRQGGDGGPAVVAHDPGASPLLERVASGDSNERMPPEGPPLTLSQIESLRGWVLAGAAGPPGERPEEDPRRHWAFVPPVRPVVPEIGASTGGDRRGVFDPIDAFLEVERRRAGVPALPPAPRLNWLRRVSLDLTGLPPTREEQDAFCRDTSPIAFERVVDRLLASPQYGERWARHWMDVWRYSDWYGRRAVPDVLNSYAQIWRWRDWIVANLNRDRGYDAMLRAMLAADELTPTDASELVATGFLVRNWYRWNYNTWMKDNVEHVSKALIGLTVNCAHCHDHKYDPITQNDYFALRAIFEPLELRHDRVPGEPDPGPYPKYDYGKAYGPIRSGLVRVFDEKLDAQTFLYTKGESRNIVPGRPPIEPGVPRFLQGDRFKVEPVALPPESSYPGLQEFVQHDERVRLVASCRAAAEARDKTRAEAHALRRELSHRWAAWSPDVPLAFVDPLLAVPAFHNGSAPPVELARLVARAGEVLRAREVDEAVARAAECELEAFEARVRADAVRHGRVPGDATAEARLANRAESRAALAKAEAECARAEQALARATTTAQRSMATTTLDAARASRLAAVAAQAKVSETFTPLSPTYPSRSTGRRTALARWITARTNPLTARVAVNHIWRWHFGQPLVATTFDFGRNGAAPSHPALLDWLAVELMEPSEPGVEPWSLKRLHRRIVLSAAYRMASSTTSSTHAGFTRDRDNRWYWRFPRTRMEAEVVRDSILHLAGQLDTRLGGADIDFSQGLTERRRSLYFTHHGEARMPFLELFDAPDACDAYRRTSSVVPQQALALVNNELVVPLSDRLAARLWETASRGQGQEPASRFVSMAFEQVLGRSPTPAEQALAERFLTQQTQLLARSLASPREAEPRARRDLVHALFNHNDFITIH